jgi:hypothetical protein
VGHTHPSFRAEGHERREARPGYERFKEALRPTRQRLIASKMSLKILNINRWNEWTEGSYREPDKVNRYKYLEAVREVYGSNR